MIFKVRRGDARKLARRIGLLLGKKDNKPGGLRACQVSRDEKKGKGDQISHLGKGQADGSLERGRKKPNCSEFGGKVVNSTW